MGVSHPVQDVVGAVHRFCFFENSPGVDKTRERCDEQCRPKSLLRVDCTCGELAEGVGHMFWVDRLFDRRHDRERVGAHRVGHATNPQHLGDGRLDELTHMAGLLNRSPVVHPAVGTQEHLVGIRTVIEHLPAEHRLGFDDTGAEGKGLDHFGFKIGEIAAVRHCGPRQLGGFGRRTILQHGRTATREPQPKRHQQAQ